MKKAKSSKMSYTTNKQKTNKTSKSGTGWENAIAEAERLIRVHKARIKQLNGSIRIFKDKLQAGEQFPTQEQAN